MAGGHIEPVEERAREMSLIKVEAQMVRWSSKKIDLERVSFESGRSVLLSTYLGSGPWGNLFVLRRG